MHNEDDSFAGPGGGHRNRRRYDVRVDREVVRDTRLSFRALGALAWVLDRPDGWQIRAEQMANEGKRPDGTGPGGERHNREGREAIRTALKELGEAGHYRIERRRLRSGKFAMGTAASDLPVKAWAAQWEFFGGKPVPVVEQADGSFWVRYPDGTLLPEDAMPPEAVVPGGKVSGGTPPTGDGFPGPGVPGPGEAGPGKAAPLGKGLRVTRKETPPPTPPRPARATKGTGWEEVEEDGSPDETETALAATTLDAILERALTDPRRAPRGRHRAELVRLVAGVTSAGWHPLDVGVAVGDSLDDAQSVFGVLRHRLTELGPPPARVGGGAGRRSEWPAWCGECVESTRQVEQADGRPARCPRCHPLVVSQPVKD